MTRFAIDPASLVRLSAGDIELDRQHQLVAPNSIRTRALDLLVAQVRSGRLSSARAVDMHTRMTELKVRVLGDRVSRRTAWEIALARDGASVLDAEYVAVAKLQADALVTTDRTLAALARGIVPLARFEELLSA